MEQSISVAFDLVIPSWAPLALLGVGCFFLYLMLGSIFLGLLVRFRCVSSEVELDKDYPILIVIWPFLLVLRLVIAFCYLPYRLALWIAGY